MSISSSPLDMMTSASPAATPTTRASSLVLDVMFAVTTGALFIGDAVGPGKAFLFSILSLCTAAAYAPRLLRTGFRVSIWSLALALFLFVHVSWALMVSNSLFITKLAQTGLALAFALPFVDYYQRASMTRYLRLMGVILAAVAAYSAGWHVTHGRPVGWKHLWDTKHVFTLLPFALAVFLTTPAPRNRLLGPVLLVITTLGIVLSGQRKAMAALIVAAPFLVNLRSPMLYLLLPFFALAIPLAQPAARAIDPTGYTSAQLATIGIGETSDVETVSTAQRRWQMEYAKHLIAQSPLYGHGTNGYMREFAVEYPTAFVSRDLTIAAGLNFHGEFIRVLIDTGAIGFGTLVVLLMISAIGIVKPKSDGRQRSLRERCLAGLFYAILLLHMSFEAFDTIMIVGYCLAPFLWKLRWDSPISAGEPPAVLADRSGPLR